MTSIAIEKNYLTSWATGRSRGRVGGLPGPAAKLFIRPEELRRQYTQCPAWLQALMVAWADGLNFFLQSHPR